MNDNQIDYNRTHKLTTILLDTCKNTGMYKELKHMVESVVDCEITGLLFQSKYIHYYSSSIIPIIFPLCVLYKRTMSIKWLTTNCVYHNNCGRPVLLANMIKYDLYDKYIEIVPKEWHPRKNILSYLCDDFEATLRYIKINPKCFEDESIDLYNCCVQTLEYFVKNSIIGYDMYHLFKRFVGLSFPDSVQKIEYLQSKFGIDYIVVISQLSAGRQCPIVLEALYKLMKNDVQRRLFCETILVIESEMVFSENQSSFTAPSILFAGKKLELNGTTAFGYMGIEPDDESYEEYMNDFLEWYDKS